MEKYINERNNIKKEILDAYYLGKELRDSDSDWEDCDDEVYFKMVFIVNCNLGMGKGKTASQVGHATLGLYKLLQKDFEKYGHSLDEWLCSGEKKICVRGKDNSHLYELQKKASVKNLATYLVEDAGKTQVDEGAITVLSIFGDEDTINEVTGRLRLL